MRQSVSGLSITAVELRPRRGGSFGLFRNHRGTGRLLVHGLVQGCRYTERARLVDDLSMKRVRIAKGKHVVISDQLAAKAARVFASGLTREQVLDVMVNEPRHATGLMAGSKKPLALSRPRRAAHGETSSSALANEDSAKEAQEGQP